MKITCLAYGLLLAVPLVIADTTAPRGSRATWTPEEVEVIRSMRLDALPGTPPDPSNRYADDAEAARLGKALFFDKRLSRNGAVSCASCHDPSRGFQDDRPVGVGVGTGRRRSMPVVDAVQSPWLFWDGRKDSLWSQALGPLEDPAEHGGTRAGYVRMLATHYADAYRRVFGALPDPGSVPSEASPVGTDAQRAAWEQLDSGQRRDINRAYANMGKAIAAFERTLRHAPSRFDRYAQGLDESSAPDGVLTAQEVAGLRVFIGRGQCVSCHSGPLMTDFSFHNTGVPAVAGMPADRGRGEALARAKTDEFNCLGAFSDARPEQCEELTFMPSEDPTMTGAFKTPGLRGVADRPPYMHAGQFKSIDDVIRHYVQAPAAPVGKSELSSRKVRVGRAPIALSERDVRDLAAFLATLSPEPERVARGR